MEHDDISGSQLEPTVDAAQEALDQLTGKLSIDSNSSSPLPSPGINGVISAISNGRIHDSISTSDIPGGGLARLEAELQRAKEEKEEYEIETENAP